MNNLVQSNSFDTDIEGALESIRIIKVSVLSEIRGFFPQGQSKLSV